MYKKSILLFYLALLLSCGKAPSPETMQATGQPEVILAQHECHLCGMVILPFPGPKGQVFVKGQPHSLKFCSTVDLLSWLLQPENQYRIDTFFVHDMAKANWKQPEEQFYVRGDSAWYVWGHNKKGAMGHTLASFKEKQDALAFSQKFGGKLYQYKDIDVALLTSFTQK